MLATVGFLVGEAVEGSTILFNGEVTGPAITHIPHVNQIFWLALGAGDAKAEAVRAESSFLEPSKVPLANPVFFEKLTCLATLDLILFASSPKLPKNSSCFRRKSCRMCTVLFLDKIMLIAHVSETRHFGHRSLFFVPSQTAGHAWCSFCRRVLHQLKLSLSIEYPNS